MNNLREKLDSIIKIILMFIIFIMGIIGLIMGVSFLIIVIAVIALIALVRHFINKIFNKKGKNTSYFKVHINNQGFSYSSSNESDEDVIQTSYEIIDDDNKRIEK